MNDAIAEVLEEMKRASIKILALDPGTSAGFACSNGQFGKWDLSRSNGDPEGLPLLLFYRRLAKFVAENQIEVLAYEKVFQIKGQRAGRGIQYGWESVMQMTAAEYGLTLQAYWPSNIKKRFTGSGKADKEAMKAQLLADHGLDVDDHNVADALCLLFLARQDCQ